MSEFDAGDEEDLSSLSDRDLIKMVTEELENLRASATEGDAAVAEQITKLEKHLELFTVSVRESEIADQNLRITERKLRASAAELDAAIIQDALNDRTSRSH